MKRYYCTLLAFLGLAVIPPAYSQVINTNGQVFDLTALRLAASQYQHARTNHIPFVPSNVTNGWRAPVARPALASDVQQIKATATGASAQFGLQKVDFGSDIAAKHPIKLVSPDGQKLWCRPTALGYFDTQSGQSVILSWVKSSLGEIQATNQVLYRDAFTDLRADVQYEYSGNCLEQNIILRERPAAPETFGLNPETTHLEIWTAWSNAKHLRTQRSSVTLRQQGNGLDRQTADDTTVDFGVMKIARGKAFKLGADPQPLTVAKEWHSSASGGFLLEIVDYKAVEDKLATLPTFGAIAPKTNEMSGCADRKTLLAALGEVKAQPESKSSIHLAQARPEDSSGVVLDFVMVASVPLPQDAFAWWKADANTLDLLGSNNGILINGATYAAGEVCDGFSVNGVASYVKIPHSATLDPGEQFTLEFWLKADANNAMNTYQGVVTSDFYGVEISNGYGGAMGLNFFTSPDAGVTWNMISTANGGGAAITAGDWHHVAGTYDGANMQLYVDGQAWGNPFACSGAISAMPANGFLAIGSEAGRVTCGCSRYFKGVVDEVTLYQRALSPSDIESIWKAGGGGKSNPDCYANWSDVVTWWPGDGNANDLMGNNNGSLQGSATYSYGRVARAFNLNGEDSYVEVPDNIAFNFGTTDFSMECWVNFRDLGGGDLYNPEAIFLAHDEGGGDQNKWIFGLNGRLLTLLVDDPIVGVQFLGQVPFDPDLNTWYHLAMVRNGDALDFYVNGVCIGGGTITADLLPAAAPLTIGQAEGIGYVNGLMDEVTIYNRALTGTEIAATYSAGTAGKCKDDLNRNQIPDWWELKYFGSVEPAGSVHYHYENGEWVPDMAGDYDGDETPDLDEYNNGTDPNIIQFAIDSANDYVNHVNVTAQLTITAGVPSYYAIFLEGSTVTNWLPFASSTVAVNLGATDGDYNVIVGLRGLPADATQTWRSYSFTLDRVPPVVTITNPVLAGAAATVVKPYLQLQGFADEPLSHLAYDLNNSAQTAVDQEVLVTGQFFDTNKLDFTTNVFQAYDIPLASAANSITLRVTDRAGNTTTTNLNVVLDYSQATTAPVVNLIWPPNGMAISGSTCTIRGTMSDETGTIEAQVVNGDNTTTTLTGLVERNNMFWIEDVPLNGINHISIKATDASGNNTATTSLVLNPSSLTLTVDQTPTGDDLYLSRGTVLGTVSDANANVTVNGMIATVVRDANINSTYNWTANNVPIHGQGTATFDAMAVTGGSVSSPDAAVSLAVEMPWSKITKSYYFKQKSISVIYSEDGKVTGGSLAQKVNFESVQVPLPTSEMLSTYSGDFDTLKSMTIRDTTYQHDMGTWSDCDPRGTTTNDTWNSTDNVHHLTPGGAAVPTFPVSELCGPYVTVTHYYAKDVDETWVTHRGDGSISCINTLRSSAATEEELYTGGKAPVGRQSLFGVYCGGMSYGRPPVGGYGTPWWGAPGWNIDPIRLMTLGKAAGADGMVWKALPDNTHQSVTIRAPGIKHFHAWANPQKYDLRVHRLKFKGSGQHEIMKDDGNPTPSPYHCVVSHDNHVVYSYPTLYVSGSTIMTDTDFDVRQSGGATLVIRGKVSGMGTPCTLWATSYVSGGRISDWTVETTANYPIPAGKVDYYQPLTIDWSYSVPSLMKFVPAGRTTNQVYVSLAEPTTANLYHTVVHLACSKTGATTENQAAANTWSLFSGPADVKTWDGKPLHYYQPGIPWAAIMVNGTLRESTDVNSLLKYGNGQCGAWRQLLESAWGINGISSQEATVSSPGKKFLVGNWSFGMPDYANDPPYVYLLQLNLCLFGTDTRPTTSLPCPGGNLTNSNGIQGQSSQTPAEKFFTWHFIQKYNGIYYDPSYGVTYTGPADFQAKAVAGFAVPGDLPDLFRVKLPSNTVEMEINP